MSSTSRVPLAGLCIGAALALAGCQVYDFEPVQPITIAQTTQKVKVTFRELRPDLMMVLDRSGSMAGPVNCASSSCPSRLEEVQTAMGAFLSSHRELARYGMVPFSLGDQDDSCQAPGIVDIPVYGVELTQTNDVTADLDAAADAVSAKVAVLTAGGSTPTAASLQALQGYAPLHDADRNDFVLLITDGFPNCNADNPNTCADLSACRCTRLSCSGSYCSTGCLDEDATVTAVQALHAAGIETVVVGFGSDVVGPVGLGVLNALGDAGGFGRPCQGNADCDASDTCNLATHQCNAVRFYTAQDHDQLAGALAAISTGIVSSPCIVVLDTLPTDPQFLSVELNGAVLPANQPDTWRLEGSGTVHFLGSTCDMLSHPPAGAPLDLEFHVVQLL